MALVIAGMDLTQPLTQPETILLVSGIFLIGLLTIMVSIFYILRELKLLKSLVGDVKGDLNSFGSNLARLENLGRTKKVYTMKRYIKASVDKGVPWKDIEKTLLAQGWDRQTVQQHRRR